MSKLIQSLQDPSLYDHPIEQFEVIETHISWVLLTGPYAYKIKKPVNLGFLDFSTLESRYFYCHKEVRLNRRFVPQLYLDVVAITGSEDAPKLNGSGTTLEYAVKMVEFPQPARLDRVCDRGELSCHHIDQLAKSLAAFHRRCAVALPESPFGTEEKIYHPVGECFEQMRALLVDAQEQSQLTALEDWCGQEFDRNRAKLRERKLGGFIRECHGDAHLANMVLLSEKVFLFDCIEFNENLRWIDVMSEVAFVTMDLDDRKVPEMANRFLNRYLEETGDYEGVLLLRFFQVYRSLVRAKVAVIRLNQTEDEQAKEVNRAEYRTYLKLASRYTEARQPRLIITHGFSGTGKTILAEALAERTGMIRLRTDIERKRRFGLRATEKSDSKQKSQMYQPAVTKEVYQQLAAQAEQLISAGYSVIVDGTFLKRQLRNIFEQLAKRLTISLKIFNLVASPAKMRARIIARDRDDQDASEADLNVLEQQLKFHEPLDETEEDNVINIDAEATLDIDHLVKLI